MGCKRVPVKKTLICLLVMEPNIVEKYIHFILLGVRQSKMSKNSINYSMRFLTVFRILPVCCFPAFYLIFHVFCPLLA